MTASWKADRSSKVGEAAGCIAPMAMAGNALARGADNQLVFPQTLALFFTPSKASTRDSHGGGSLPIALILIWMGIGILSPYLLPD
jgi:hypothetical protein